MLLILRVTLGLLVVFHSVQCLLSASQLTVLAAGVAAIVMVDGACLVLGVLTPVVASLAAVGGLALILPGLLPLAPSSWDSRPFQMSMVLISGALAVLGPGAYSLDARLFGLKRLILPRTRTP